MSSAALDTFNTNQKLPFLFEVTDGNGGSVYQYVLPINPENYECTATSRTNFTYTQGGGFEDNIGMANPKISMSGTFTYSGNVIITPPPFNPLDPSSYAGLASGVSAVAGLFGAPVSKGPGKTIRLGDSTNLTGWDMYQEFAGMIFQFYELFGTAGVTGGESSDWDLANQLYKKNGLQASAISANKPTLNFFNFTEQQYFQVQINRFVIKRSVQRRLLYQYDLQMTVLGDANTLALIAADAGLATWTAAYALVPPELGLFQSALSAYGTISNAVSTLSNLMDDASNSIGIIRTAVNAFVGNVNNVAQSATNLAANATATLTQLSNLGTLLPTLYSADGSTQIQTEYRTVEDANSSVAQALAVALTIDGLPHEFVDMLRQSQREIFVYQANQRLFLPTANTGVSTTSIASAQDPTKLEILTGTPASSSLAQNSIALSVPESTLFSPNITTPISSAVREVVIRGNDSIETIARDCGYDWKQIAALNNLDYPYIAQSNPNGLNVLLPGEMIQIPSTPTVPLFAGNSTEGLDLLLFGIDEYLDQNGDQGFDASGDAATVGGLDNLNMQLTHRQNTPRGALALLGHPTYGSLLQTYIGKPNLDIWIRRVLLEEKNVLLQDPRVSSVPNVTLQAKDDAYYAVADVVLINKTSLSNLSMPLLLQNV